MDLAKLIDLAEKYDYKPDGIHLDNLSEFVADNASGISALCKDYAALQQKLETLDSDLGKLAGSMLNRTLDADRKQAVAYAECAAMVAKFAAQLLTAGQADKDGE